MTKKERAITVGAIAIVLLIVLIVQWSKKDRLQQDSRWMVQLKMLRHNANKRHSEESAALVERYRPVNTANAEPFDLSRGSCGVQVELMQRFLNTYCRQTITEDGIWGYETEDAVHDYCTNHTGYLPPLYGRFWAMQGNGYTMNHSNFNQMLVHGGTLIL